MTHFAYFMCNNFFLCSVFGATNEIFWSIVSNTSETLHFRFISIVIARTLAHFFMVLLSNRRGTHRRILNRNFLSVCARWVLRIKIRKQLRPNKHCKREIVLHAFHNFCLFCINLISQEASWAWKFFRIPLNVTILISHENSRKCKWIRIVELMI